MSLAFVVEIPHSSEDSRQSSENSENFGKLIDLPLQISSKSGLVLYSSF